MLVMLMCKFSRDGAKYVGHDRGAWCGVRGAWCGVRGCEDARMPFLRRTVRTVTEAWYAACGSKPWDHMKV